MDGTVRPVPNSAMPLWEDNSPAAITEPPEPAAEHYLRSETRVNSRVPITLECLEGENREAIEAHTMDASPKGCLVVLQGCFSVGQSFRIINRITRHSVAALISWRGRQTRAGWEYGMELLNPTADFWGLEF
jgi:hypothetical protein